MSNFRFISVLFFILFVINTSFSQNSPQFLAIEDSVKSYFIQIKHVDDNQLKADINKKIFHLLDSVLKNSESFSFNFDSIKSIGLLNSPDNNFRFITWFYPLSDGTYKYFGFIQLKEKDGSVKIFELSDRFEGVDDIENSVLSAGKWYGCLYYKMLKNKVDNHTYYTLLALRYNDLFTTSKIIEIFYFDEFENPVFGAPLFKMENNKMKIRVVFQFSGRVMMNLKYDEKLKMIIFDHLSPSETAYTGHYEYYGPDFTFDGFEFKGKNWCYKANLDLRRSEATKTYIPQKSSKIR